MKQKVKYKGIMFIVLSALCFAFMNVFVRMAGDLYLVLDVDADSVSGRCL